MKQFLKRAARSLAVKPYVGPFVRFAIAIVRFPALNHRHNVFIVQQLPQMLDTLSEIHHRQARFDADQENFVRTAPATLRQLTLDVAQLRRELKASAGGRSVNVSGQPASTRGRWQGDALRVNLNCGSAPKAGYVNVDTRQFPGVDVVAEFDDLPFHAGSIRELFSSHLLERFAPDQLRRSILPHFFQMLAPGGRLHTVVSDVDALIRSYTNGNCSGDDLRDAIFGSPVAGRDSRRNIFSERTLTDLLKGAGFVNISVLAHGRPDGRDYELEIVAEKGNA